MSLDTRFASEGHPSFVTTNMHERRPILGSAPACELLVEQIYAARRDTGCKLVAFAVMPDHLHLIVVPGAGGVARVVQLVKGRFARAYNQSRGGEGAVWQGRYHERAVRSEPALMRAIEYVHGNPVAARLADRQEAYRWSTASGMFPTDLDEVLGLRQAEA